MTILKCKMCGGDIPATEGAVFATCESCGTTSTLPKASDERKANLFNRANHFRRLNDFDKALQTYENILDEDNTDAEAHWGAVLSRYGIEYVEDPATRQRIPTCHRVQSEPVLRDPDCLAALEHAPDAYARSLYEAEAKRIAEIQKDILAISSREEPHDVFICYKETTDAGTRTPDSVLAQEVYHQLVNDGCRVFFSRITLEDKLGRQYEPYIFSALNSARVMLVIGTRREHFEAPWVKNEWSRFLAIRKKDPSRLLIPCYRGMDAYDLPDELANLQSQDMAKLGFIQDLLRGVKKVLDAGKNAKSGGSILLPGSGAAPVAPGVESLMKRGWLFLEDAEWKQADEYFDKVLDIDPEHAPAYVGKLCAELEVRNENEIGNTMMTTISDLKNLKNAIRFSNIQIKAKIQKYEEIINERIKYTGLVDKYNQLIENVNIEENTEFKPKLNMIYDGIITGYDESRYNMIVEISSNKIFCPIINEILTVIAGLDNIRISRINSDVFRYRYWLKCKFFFKIGDCIKLKCVRYSLDTDSGYVYSYGEALRDLRYFYFDGNSDESEYSHFLKMNRYQDATDLKYFNAASDEKEYFDLAKEFRTMNGYLNTEEFAIECDNQYHIHNERRKKQHQQDKEYLEKHEHFVEQEQKDESKRRKLFFGCLGCLGVIVFFLFLIIIGSC